MEDLPIDRAIVAEGPLASMLRSHPKVRTVETQRGAQGIEFVRNGRSRFVFQGKSDEELKGLVELMDNNPLVCADRFSVPDPASTLALIALGPAALAGLLLETPTLATNAPIHYSLLNAFLGTVSWAQGVQIQPLAGDETLYLATITAKLGPATPAEIRDLYHERYDASFYVGSDSVQRQIEQMEPSDPSASYVLHVSRVNDGCALNVRVIAHENGKCGAAQMVHAMNVMAGFEESLGIG